MWGGNGEVEIDNSQRPKYGVTNIVPGQFARRSHRNGNIIQGANGKTHRNLTVMRATKDGNLLQLNREGEGEMRWSVNASITVHDPPEDLEVLFDNYTQTAAPISGQLVILESSFRRQKEMVLHSKFRQPSC
jgi:hypothetical protein